MKKYIHSLIILLTLSSLTNAQDKIIGSWTDHLAFNKGTSIATDGVKIYCGTMSGLFIYNSKDNSIEKHTKVNGLSEVSINKLGYNVYNDKLVIIYNNGNIDIIGKNSQYNIPFIKQSDQISDKEVKDIYFKNEYAYLSFNTGIVVLNTSANEIKDTYKIKANNEVLSINSTAINDQKIYAATDKGIYWANLDTNLLDFNNWSQIPNYSNNKIQQIFIIQNSLYAVIDSIKGGKSNLYEVANNNQFTKITSIPKQEYVASSIAEDHLLYVTKDTNYIIDNQMKVTSKFIALNSDRVLGLTMVNDIIYRVNDFSPLRSWSTTGKRIMTYRPAGPVDDNVFAMASGYGELWTVAGGYNSAFNNNLNYIKINRYENGAWTLYNNNNSTTLKDVYDPVSIYLNPNEKGHAYISTWSYGLFEFDKEKPFKNYDNLNSPLEYRSADTNWLGVSSSVLDKDNNLWVVNTHVANCIAVKKANGDWQNYNFASKVSDETRISEIEITKNGLIWVALPKRNEILVFDNNNTIDNKQDDRSLIIGQEVGKGDLPGIRGITMAIDKLGQMWVGTSEGIVVDYNPDQIFEKDNIDLDKILIDNGENVEVLLQGASILSIDVDGANNKWIGTEVSGVYQLSPDGKNVLNQFTTENSPIISNTVKSIAIDDQTGEIYFGTALGIVSYRSSVVSGKDNYSELKVFPNPVRNNYNGPIAISGLMDKTTVKITDVSGSLVNEFISEGGQILWQGTNMKSEKVSSGVYLIMVSGEDEFGNLSTKSQKVLFLK